MKSHSTRILPPTLLAAALAAAFGPAIAQDADAIRQLTKPSSSLEVGVGGVSDDNQRFGQYTGLNEKGGYGIANIDYVTRNDLTGMWTRLTGRNLGFDNRELRFETSRQGSWGVFVEYNQIPRFDPYTVTTQLTGIGTTTQTIAGGAATTYHLKTERNRASVGFNMILVKGLGLDVRFSSETKEGERLWGQGTFGTWRFLTDPIDQTTQQLEAKLNYSTENLQLSGGYYGTMFENKNNRLNVVGAALFAGSNEIALPPDNESHQFFLAGGYSFSKATRLNFKAAFGRITQNEAFPNTPVVGAPTSLNGQIDTTLLQGGLTTRVSQNLSLRGDLRYENRDDKTPVFRYFPSQNTVGATNDGTNETRDIETTSGKFEAKYRLPGNVSVTGGLDYELKKRNSPPVRSVDFREKTDEVTVRGEARRSISETLTGAVGVSHSRRRGSDWLPNTGNQSATTTGDLIAPLHLIDRDRDTVRLVLNWMPTEPLGLNFRFDHSKDDYAGRDFTIYNLGPREGTAQLLSVDASYTFSDSVQGNAWVSHSETTYEDALCRAPTTANTCPATDASPVWGADLKNIADSFGLGVRAKITSKIELKADAVYSKVKDEMKLLSIDPTNSSTVNPLPDTNTKVTTLKLSGTYALNRNSAVRLQYVHDEYKTDDWTWAYWNYSPVEGGTTVRQDPNQKVDFVGVSYLYRF